MGLHVILQGQLLRFKIYKKGPFNINLKIKRPDTPVVEGKKGEKYRSQSDIFNVMAKSKIRFEYIRQYTWFIWEVIFSEGMETKFRTALSSKMKG
jgi:hypothetical protein